MALPNYNRTTWENADSTQTPLNAANLNNIEDGISRATAAIQALENSGVSPEAITAAVNAYLDEHGAENLVYEALDLAFTGDPYIAPTLLVDNTIDATYNPNGHYILYYIDSDGGRHNLFDFSNYFAEKAAVPSKTSQLTNDSGFITARDVPYVTPQQFGAKGDGVHDDTEAINACFASGASNVYFPKGTYLVDAHHDGFTHETEGGLRPQSNCVITLDADATIKCSTSPTDFYNILHFVNVSNVIVQGGKIVGDKATHVQVSQPTYEFGHGVGIQNSTNIVVRDMEISDCIGDGVILNVSGNADITLDNLTIHDCRRQGISLTSGDGITISNCKIYDISGTNPQSGIDIEPDGEKSVTNVVIDSCDIHDTVGASVIVTNVANVIDQIHINGCLFDHALFLGGSNVTMSGGKSKKVSVKSDKAPIISACSIEEVAVSGGNSAFVGCNFASSGKDQFLTVTSDVVSGNPAESIVFTDCDFNIVNCTHFVFMPANAVDRVKLLKFSDCRAKITHALTSTYAASGFSNFMPSKTVISGCEFEFTAKIYQLFTTKPGTTNVVEITDSSIVNSNSDRTAYFISGNAAYDVWIENSTLTKFTNMLYGGDASTGIIVLLNDKFSSFAHPEGKISADDVIITNVTRENTQFLSGATGNIQKQIDAKSDFSGSYNDLADKPTIPTKTSQLTNDSGFLTSHQSLANYYNKTEVNSLLDSKADKSEIPDISGKADKATTYTKSEVDELVSSGVVPQYVIDESESVLAKAFSHTGLGRTVRFIAVSDAHNDAAEVSHSYTRIANKHCGQAVKYIAERIPLDFVASLGDMTWAGVAHTTAQYQTDWLKADLQEMNLFLRDGFGGVPNIRVVGNHDQCATTGSGGAVSRLQNSGAYQLIGRYNAGTGDGLSNYGYYDIERAKLRVIYLNTSDTVNTSTQGTLLSVSQAQKNWLCETLIALNEKSDAAGWKILLMSHAPLDMNSGIAADILLPYTNGGSYGSYAFTNHSAKIIGNCHGHTHCYNVGYMSDKIRRFTIPNANFYDNNHYKNNASYAAWNEDTTYPKTENSRTDTSFSLVTVDLDSLTCYVDNYGAGYDREFSLDYKSEPAPVNLFDKTDADVVIGGRFNTSRAVAADQQETLVTGYIPATTADVLHVVTNKANNSTAYVGAAQLYDSGKNYIGIYISPKASQNAGISPKPTWAADYLSGDFDLSVTPNSGTNAGVAYIRFCLAYTDIDEIVITKG